MPRSKFSDQDSPVFDGGSDVIVAEDLICAARHGQVLSCAFKSFRVLAKGSRRIGNGLFQGISCRKTSLDVRKPDAERAIGLFFNDRYVLCRHDA